MKNKEQTKCDKCLSQEASIEIVIEETCQKLNLCDDCADRFLFLLLECVMEKSENEESDEEK